MRNTTLSQLPIAWRGFLYYIAAFCLLLCLSTAAALPAHAEEIADSSSSTSDSTDTDDDLTLAGTSPTPTTSTRRCGFRPG